MEEIVLMAAGVVDIIEETGFKHDNKQLHRIRDRCLFRNSIICVYGVC